MEIKKIIGILIITFTIITACSKSSVKDDFIGGHCLIKNQIYNGEINTKFIYNHNNKINEYQSFYFYEKYVYDSNGRIIRKEGAYDSSNEDEFMTSTNSFFTYYTDFNYNNNGKLLTKKNYLLIDSVFEYRSMISLEYDNDNIIIYNLHDAENKITQFWTYEYDENGNVVKEKHWSNLFIQDSQPELQSETSYKYDNKKNPFIIFNELGEPGINYNKNNIIEVNLIRHKSVPGFNKYETSTVCYEYNSQGYPVKIIDGTTVNEYECD